MRLFAIADLHLAQTVDKPMDVFGPRWDRHVERICRNWEETVEENDTVLVGGDISWAGSLDQARSDLELLHRLPGRKILLRGNHDYWWTTVRKMQDFCQTHGFSSLEFLRNDARLEAGFWVCGTRGWVLPPDEAFREEDEKIFRREVLRLDLSLADLERQRRAGESRDRPWPSCITRRCRKRAAPRNFLKNCQKLGLRSAFSAISITMCPITKEDPSWTASVI